MKSRKRGCFIFFLFIIVAIVLFSNLGSCSNSTPINTNDHSLSATIDQGIKDAGVTKESVEINDDVGTSQKGDNVILIHVKAADNLTTNMFKKGMWLNTTKILKPLKSRADIGEITIFWSTDFEDAYGSNFNSNAMKIKLSKKTLDKINFDSFNIDNLPKIADGYWQHASLN